MTPPSKDVCGMLEAESNLGLTFAVNLFVGKEPSTPVDCVTVFDTPGWPPQLTLGEGENYYYPSIQIRVRNRSYLDGWDLVNSIKIALHGKNHETWNAMVYHVIFCISEPALLDWDENGRARFIINFELQRS